VVLLVPEGIGRLFAIIMERFRPRKMASMPVSPDLDRLASAMRTPR
jgi:hypothetical protein